MEPCPANRSRTTDVRKPDRTLGIAMLKSLEFNRQLGVFRISTVFYNSYCVLLVLMTRWLTNLIIISDNVLSYYTGYEKSPANPWISFQQLYVWSVVNNFALWNKSTEFCFYFNEESLLSSANLKWYTLSRFTEIFFLDGKKRGVVTCSPPTITPKTLTCPKVLFS